MMTVGSIADKQHSKIMEIIAEMHGSSRGGPSSSSTVSGMTMGIGSKIHGKIAVNGMGHGDGLETNGVGAALTGIVTGGGLSDMNGKVMEEAGLIGISLTVGILPSDEFLQCRQAMEWTALTGVPVAGIGMRLLKGRFTE